MKKFRLFITVFFLLASFITILLFTLFDNVLFFKAADVIKNNIWPAGIALFVFLVLLTTGIVSNHAKPDESLINNGYFQSGHPGIIFTHGRSGLFQVLSSAAGPDRSQAPN